MANFLSVEKTPPTYPVSGVGLGGRTTHNARGEYTILAALALNDTIQLFDLPPGARIIGGQIKSDDLDTGGTAIRINVGDAGDVDRYFAASAIASTGGVDSTMAATGVDYYTDRARVPVFLTVSVAPTTGATTGTVMVRFSYTVEEPK